jgi:hypothetical protein
MRLRLVALLSVAGLTELNLVLIEHGLHIDVRVRRLDPLRRGTAGREPQNEQHSDNPLVETLLYRHLR